jgi:hypothetical protein
MIAASESIVSQDAVAQWATVFGKIDPPQVTVELITLDTVDVFQPIITAASRSQTPLSLHRLSDVSTFRSTTGILGVPAVLLIDAQSNVLLFLLGTLFPEEHNLVGYLLHPKGPVTTTQYLVGRIYEPFEDFTRVPPTDLAK